MTDQVVPEEVKPQSLESLCRSLLALRTRVDDIHRQQQHLYEREDSLSTQSAKAVTDLNSRLGVCSLSVKDATNVAKQILENSVQYDMTLVVSYNSRNFQEWVRRANPEYNFRYVSQPEDLRGYCSDKTRVLIIGDVHTNHAARGLVRAAFEQGFTIKRVNEFNLAV